VERRAFFYQLWDDPPVFVIAAGVTMHDGMALALGLARGRPAHVLVRPSWLMEAQAEQVCKADQWLRATHPRIGLTAMATTAEDAEAWRARGVAAIHAHNLAFIDEAIFRPEPDAAKLYDAVHIAQTGAFKRHELAHGVPRLALITYQASPAEEAVQTVADRYRDLAYLNRLTDGLWMPADAVREVIVGSHCGLVLSAEEGPNNASMEYFLCGAPLVTTPALGGREAMYAPGHVAVVEPTPAAVEAAVAAFVAHPPDPLEIRRQALARARPHRERMVAWLSALAERDLVAAADDDLWLPQFCDKLRETWLLKVKDDGTASASCIARPRRPRAPPP